MGSTSSARMYKRQRSTPRRRCVPTKTSATSSRRFAATRPSTSRSAPSIITWSIGSVPMSFSACSPITSSGICAKPLLFDDDDKATAEAQRDSPVVPAKPSASAQDKARTLRTEYDFPLHSFQTLIADLATIAKNRIRPKLPGADSFDQITRPTPLQRRAFDLSASSCNVPSRRLRDFTIIPF